LEGAGGDEFPPPQPASNNNQKINSAVVETALIISFPESNNNEPAGTMEVAGQQAFFYAMRSMNVETGTSRWFSK